MPVEPISPDEAIEAKVFPDEVMTGWNNVIAENLRNGRSAFTQDAAIKAIMAAFRAAGKRTTRAKIFDKGWLDVEGTYRKAGWKVEYDKPGYNETYAANFTFAKARYVDGR